MTATLGLLAWACVVPDIPATANAAKKPATSFDLIEYPPPSAALCGYGNRTFIRRAPRNSREPHPPPTPPAAAAPRRALSPWQTGAWEARYRGSPGGRPG